MRYIQMRLAERYLPKKVLNRPKQGFSVALPYMLRREYQLLFTLFLRESRLSHHGFLRQEAIDRLLAEHEGKKIDNGNRLWLLLNAEVWYRMLIEGMSIERLATEISETSKDLRFAYS